LARLSVFITFVTLIVTFGKAKCSLLAWKLNIKRKNDFCSRGMIVFFIEQDTHNTKKTFIGGGKKRKQRQLILASSVDNQKYHFLDR